MVAAVAKREALIKVPSSASGSIATLKDEMNGTGNRQDRPRQRRSGTTKKSIDILVEANDLAAHAVGLGNLHVGFPAGGERSAEELF